MNDRFLRACRGELVETTPVWIMRQAGRYMPEYLEVKKRHTFWEMCTIPEVAAEVTLQPVERLGVDAAILFSDILIVLSAMGLDVEFRPGPVLAAPIRSSSDVERLHEPAGDGLFARIGEAIRILRRELEGRVPLIGFAGSPFTLATYAVEGGASKEHAAIRALLYSEEATAHRLLQRITDGVVASLETQIAAGVQAVQLFDSWAGLLPPRAYERFALPYARQVLERIGKAGVPRIYFAPGAMGSLEAIASLEVEVVGIDWRISLAGARRVLADRHAVQGNLDPGILLGERSGIEEETIAILAEGRGARGHIMNLGHGILRQTPVENARAFVDAVHRHSAGGTDDG